ncbi:MAG: Wzz/FepE/Etk N-terminal domain-containing protein, partial [Pseudolabrys sp.]
PGRYPIQRGETLSDVIKRAGGLTKLAYPEGAVFMREDLRKKEQAQMDALASRLQADLASAQLEQAQSAQDNKDKLQTYEIGKALVAQLRSTKAAGRLVIDLNAILSGKSQSRNVSKDGEVYLNGPVNQDVVLKNGDKLYIPQKPQSVTVIGEVHYPTSHLYHPGWSRDNYIEHSGGLTYKADKKRIYVVRANGSVIASKGSWWTLDRQRLGDCQQGFLVDAGPGGDRYPPGRHHRRAAQRRAHPAADLVDQRDADLVSRRRGGSRIQLRGHLLRQHGMNDESRKSTDVSSPPQPQVPPQGYFIAVPQPPYEEDEITLRDYWNVVMRYKWMILAIVLVCTGGATGYAFMATPIYEASVLMAPVKNDEDKGALSSLAAQYGGLASMVGINLGGGGSSSDEAIATLKSRAFTDQFIKDHNLLPVLFASKWNPDTKTWNVDNPDDVPTMGDAYKLFDKKIRRVIENKQSGLVTLEIDWKNREQAASWANDLVQRLNQRMRARAIHEARKSIDYLKQELGKTSVVDLQQGINRLIETQIKKITLASVRDQYSFRIIDPAVTPDRTAYVWPRKGLLVVLSIVIGLIAGIFVAFLANAARAGGQQG